jgi:nucleoside-diphosphate-sugar epimerase
VGAGVRTKAIGDRVILHWRPSEGIAAQGAVYDWHGTTVNSGPMTCFSTETIVSENRLTKLPAHVDPRVAPLYGCAFTTAYGVVVNDAKVKPGDKVIVFGFGGVGQAVAAMALCAGARVVGMDRVPGKVMGVPAWDGQERGFDVAVDITGDSQVIQLAYEVTHKTGRVVLVGVPRHDDPITIDSLPLHFGKSVDVLPRHAVGDARVSLGADQRGAGSGENREGWPGVVEDGIMNRVLVTGGCGYVGSVVVPLLIDCGYRVTVLDAMLFGNHLTPHPHVRVVEGDIRELPAEIRRGRFDAVIHLACIANDPSWALDPAWGKSVNYDALGPLVQWAKDAGVQRFLYASSSSVYGTKPEGVEVTERLSLEPLTDYSKYKALGEDVALEQQSKLFTVSVLRPATVCGYAPRLRLDVVVNQMTIDALTKGTITVHCGRLYRAHLHVQDMALAYVRVLEAEAELVGGQVFNVGGENLQIGELARKVQAQAGGTIVTMP